MAQFFFLFFYNFFILVVGGGLLIFQRLFKGKYKQSFAKRFGKSLPNVLTKKGQQLFWLHAVSVGETKALAPIAWELKEKYPQAIFLISSITETGHEEAKRSIAFAAYHIYLPLDLSWIMAKLVAKALPALVIISETDLWYNFLREAKSCGAVVAVINGKLSERSAKRLQFFTFFAKRLYAQVDLFCLQSSIYQKRLKQLGVSAAKLTITGNTKFSLEPKSMSEEKKEHLKAALGIEKESFVVVAGSTHPGEEKLIIHAMEKIWQKFPEAKLIIVPRHLERVKEIERFLASLKTSFTVWKSSRKKIAANISIVVIDVMGFLLQIYQLATVAIVGGSFVSQVGGHNILEPTWFGVPVLFGPHMFSQPELVHLALSHQTGKQVNDENLSSELLLFLSDADLRKKYSAHALELMRTLSGSANKCCTLIEAALLEQATH